MAGNAFGLDGVRASSDDAVAAIHSLLQASHALAAVGGACAAEELAPGIKVVVGSRVVHV